MSDKGQGRAILGQGASQPPTTAFPLNQNAPEFVPRNPQQHSVSQAQEPVFFLNRNAPEFVPSGQQDVAETYSQSDYDYSAGGQDPIEQLHQTVLILTSDPGSYDEVVASLATALSSSVNSEAMLLSIVEELFVQATTQSNFQYTGARVCNYLAHNWTAKAGSGNFRQHLLKRCHEEHMKREALVKDSSQSSVLIGFTFFMGELLLALTDAEGNRLDVLVLPIEELLSTLLTQPSESNLKCVAQVLKLTGATLDSVEKSGNEGSPDGESRTPRLDAIFESMKLLLVDGDYSRSMKNLLLSVVELRASNWGSRTAQAPPPQMYSQQPVVEHYGEEPILYDEHGEPMPYEEAIYLPDYCDYSAGAGGEWNAPPYMYNEMYSGATFAGDCGSSSSAGDIDEVARDFEQFVLETEQQYQQGSTGFQ